MLDTVQPFSTFFQCPRLLCTPPRDDFSSKAAPQGSESSPQVRTRRPSPGPAPAQPWPFASSPQGSVHMPVCGGAQLCPPPAGSPGRSTPALVIRTPRPARRPAHSSSLACAGGMRRTGERGERRPLGPWGAARRAGLPPLHTVLLESGSPRFKSLLFHLLHVITGQ